MTVYAIAQLTIHKRDAYDRYQAKFFDVFRKYQGQLLAADEAPHVIEGDWDMDKIVIMSFPDKDAFEAWAYSPEYAEISKDRIAGASATIILVNGFS